MPAFDARCSYARYSLILLMRSRPPPSRHSAGRSLLIRCHFACRAPTRMRMMNTSIHRSAEDLRTPRALLLRDATAHARGAHERAAAFFRPFAIRCFRDTLPARAATQNSDRRHASSCRAHAQASKHTVYCLCAHMPTIYARRLPFSLLPFTHTPSRQTSFRHRSICAA